MSDVEACLSALRAAGVADVDFAMVLGTGLGGLADAVENPIIVPYAQLPGFPGGGVSGHASRLVVGTLEGKRVAFAQGRAHYYEHGDPRAMAVPVATFAALGAKVLILSNACGSLRSDWRPGSLCIISDHINFAGVNPLIGMKLEGALADSRFVPMNNAYDANLRRMMRAAAVRADVGVHDGIYMWYSGPSFETPAEIRMARILGADIIGMSTVPEIILARHAGLTCVAVAMITNLAAGIEGASPSHSETKEVAGLAAADFQRLIRAFLRDMPAGIP